MRINGEGAGDLHPCSSLEHPFFVDPWWLDDVYQVVLEMTDASPNSLSQQPYIERQR